MTLLETLRADAGHYNYANGKRWYRHPGFWVGAIQRVGYRVTCVKFGLWRCMLLVVYVALALPVRLILHVHLPRRTRIGDGFCMHHPQNIIVPDDTVIGEDVTVYHDVTIGRGPIPGVPMVGDRVTIYAGAKVLGGVTLGDDCEIGANVVITKDVPPSTVISVPPPRGIPKETIDRVRKVRRPPTGQSVIRT